MTVDPPRRLRPRAAQRNKTITTQTKGAPSAKGSTAAARPVTTRRNAQTYVPPSIGAVQTGTADVDAVSISGTTPTGGSSIAPYRSVMIGALAQGDPTAGKAVAVGYSAYIGPSSYEAVAIGNMAEATGNDAICIGTANADAVAAVAIGVGSNVSGAHSVALGESSAVTGAWATALGSHAQADGDESVAAGLSAIAADGGCIAIGFAAEAHGVNAVAIGASAAAGSSGTPAAHSVALGDGAVAAADHEFAIGDGNAIAIIRGKLVIADGSGGLHQIVVSTGGALSTVPYP